MNIIKTEISWIDLDIKPSRHNVFFVFFTISDGSIRHGLYNLQTHSLRIDYSDFIDLNGNDSSFVEKHIQILFQTAFEQDITYLRFYFMQFRDFFLLIKRNSSSPCSMDVYNVQKTVNSVNKLLNSSLQKRGDILEINKKH